MFRGDFESSIDPKGRISIPVKFREVFVETFEDERFVVTKCIVGMGDGSNCHGLSVYPYREWLALEERVDRGEGFTSAQLNSIKRLILAPAVECTADKQGRVLIPPTLRGCAALERDVVIIGMQKKIEIWSQENWERVIGQAEKDFPSDTAALASLGI